MEGFVTLRTTNATGASMGCAEDKTDNTVCLLSPLTNIVTIGDRAVKSGGEKESTTTLIVADVEAPKVSVAVTKRDPDPVEKFFKVAEKIPKVLTEGADMSPANDGDAETDICTFWSFSTSQATFETSILSKEEPISKEMASSLAVMNRGSDAGTKDFKSNPPFDDI